MTDIQKGLINLTIDELKNEITANVKDYVSESAKTAFISWVNTNLIPSIKDMGKSYIDAVRNSSIDSNGWVKIRDTLVIPAIVSGGIWLLEKAITKVIELESQK